VCIDVSIIIVNWNTHEITQGCLESVYEQTENIRFEVIVVDNASSDGSVEMVQTLFPQVALIKNKENRGFAAANNQGMTIAKGRYILLLNSDTLILDNAIEKSISFADAHPETAIVGCRVLNPDRTLQPTCGMFPSLLNQLLFCTYLYKLFPKSKFFGRAKMSWWDRDDVREVEVVSGCFMLIRRKAIKETGMFDEQFFMYSEENDLCYRMRKAGWRNMFTPQAQIIHLGGSSAVLYSQKRAVIKDSSTIKMMFKHWPLWQARLGILCMVIFYASRLLGVGIYYFLRPKEQIRKLLANHIAGLKGVLGYRHYLETLHEFSRTKET